MDNFFTRETFCSYDEQQQIEIMKDVHERLGQSTHYKTMASYKGRDSTYQNISERFF